MKKEITTWVRKVEEHKQQQANLNATKKQLTIYERDKSELKRLQALVCFLPLCISLVLVCLVIYVCLK